MEIELFDDTMEEEAGVIDQLKKTRNRLTTVSTNFVEFERLLLNELTISQRDIVGKLLLNVKAGIEDGINTSINVVDEQIEKVQAIESGTELLSLEYKASEAKGEQLAGAKDQNTTLFDQLNNLELSLQSMTSERDELRGQLTLAQEQVDEVLTIGGGDQYAEEIAARKKENQQALVKIQELEKERVRLNATATQTQKKITEEQRKHEETVKRLRGDINGLELRAGTAEEQAKAARAALNQSTQKCQNEITGLNNQLNEKERLFNQAKSEAAATSEAEIKRLRQECDASLKKATTEFLNLQALAGGWQEQNNLLTQKIELMQEEGGNLLTSGETLASQIGGLEEEKTILLIENNNLQTSSVALSNENTTLQQQLNDSNEIVESLEALQRSQQETLENREFELRALAQKEKDLAEKLAATQKREAEADASLLKLQEEKTNLILDASRIASEARDAQTKLQEASATLKNKEEQLALLTGENIEGAIQANTVLLAKQELENTAQTNKSLETQLSATTAQVKLLENQVIGLNARIVKAEEEKKAVGEAKKLVDDLIRKGTVYTISSPEGVVKREIAADSLKQFLEKTEKPSLLVIDDERKKMIESSAPYATPLQKLDVFLFGKYAPLLSRDRKWTKDYVAVERATFDKLRDDLVVCKSGGGGIVTLPAKTTSTTSTTSTTGTISTTGTTTVKGKVLTLGASVGGVSHIDALNQRGWQDRALHLRDTPSEYAAVVRFYQSDSLYGVREELTFIASNVHLIEDPNYASGESYYVIDVATADTREHLRYTNVGSLIIPAFYGHGSLEVIIESKTSGNLVKGEDIEGYAVEASSTRPYNTKMMISLSDDITAYARDTGRDTFILETLLIKA